MTEPPYFGSLGSPSIGSMSGLRPTEEQKLRSAVAYLVHLLGGEVTIPDEVLRTFSTGNPMYEVSRVQKSDGTQTYQAWETPAMPMGQRVAAAVQMLQRYDKEVEITDGWELERAMWLLTNGTNGRPHHDKLGGTSETS